MGVAQLIRELSLHIKLKAKSSRTEQHTICSFCFQRRRRHRTVRCLLRRWKQKKTDIFDDRFVRTKWATASWKVWTLAIAPLTWVRLVTSSALQYRKWQLIGMSKWCHAFGLKINARDIVSIRKLDTFSTLLLLLSSICYCLSHCAVPVFAYILDLLV